MKLLHPLWLTFVTSCSLSAQQTMFTLDSCRALALSKSKELAIKDAQIESSIATHKAARTNYLPHLTARAAYLHNGRNLSLISKEQREKLEHLGSELIGSLSSNPTLAGALKAIAQQRPELIGLLAPIGQRIGEIFSAGLDGLGTTLSQSIQPNTRNVYVGALSLTQPIYMGGKIRAYDKITSQAVEVAKEQRRVAEQELLLAVDEAYWQVVSLVGKKKLANSYLDLLHETDQNVSKMIKAGLATKADGLSVAVKLNEAEMALLKVEDGLSLSRMLLCQLCGLDLETPIQLKDEDSPAPQSIEDTSSADVDVAMAMRPELRMLSLAEQIGHQKVRIARSEHLPSLALIANGIVTNPALYNGFENKFRPTWNVGLTLQVPLWSWGQGTYQVRAAKAAEKAAALRLEETKEKVTLQVRQTAYKVKEAAQKLQTASTGVSKADENLRYARIGLREGVMATNNILEAQSAWLSAQSQYLDAQIDLRLASLYLQKALGTLQ